MEDIRFWDWKEVKLFYRLLLGNFLKSDYCIRKVPIGDLLAPLDISVYQSNITLIRLFRLYDISPI